MFQDAVRLYKKVAVVAFSGHTWSKDVGFCLARAGAKVVFASAGEAAEAGAEELRREGYESMGVPADFSRADGLLPVMQESLHAFGTIDVLVNSFNVELMKPILDTTEDEWHRVTGENCTSVFLTCKVIGRHMIEKGRGSIVNIISGFAERGLPGGGVYAASLGGVLQLTRSLALEWARKNVRVNAIGVGWKERETPDDLDPIAKYIPMKRRSRPEDIGPLLVFLSSEASSYLNGNIYHVDGGLMARG